MEFGLQLKESGIPLAIGIQNPSSTEKYWNSVPGIQNPRLDSLTWGERKIELQLYATGAEQQNINIFRTECPGKNQLSRIKKVSGPKGWTVISLRACI